MTHPVHAVLQRHGTRSLCHYTFVSRLPGIIREQAVLCRVELSRRGLPVESGHYYGDPRKEEVLTRYVSCATMPPWGMMGGESESLAILEFDTAVVTKPGTCFCPGWSPRSAYSADEIITWTEAEHAEALYTGPGYATVNGAEVFVPDEISIEHLLNVLFYDEHTANSTLPLLRAAAEETNLRMTRTINVRVDPWRFPRDWQALGPPWARGEQGEEDDGDLVL